MTDRLTERIADTLRRQAGTIDRPAFEVDAIVRDGRTAVRRRRSAAVALSTACALVVLVGIGMVAVVTRPGAPDRPGTPTPSGSSATPSPVPPTGRPTVAVASLGLDVYGQTADGESEIRRPGGQRIPLRLDDRGFDLSPVVRVPDGWVAGMRRHYGDRPNVTWFVPDTGEPRQIGQLRYPIVSPDGRTVVGYESETSLAAYALPSLTLLRRRTVVAGSWPAAVSADRRVLILAPRDERIRATPEIMLMPARATVWRINTGAAVTSTDHTWPWDLGPGGRLLRRVDVRSGDGAQTQSACVDVVPVTTTIPTGGTGLCHPNLIRFAGGRLSPDGRWATLIAPFITDNEPDTQTILVAIDDIRAGRWRPIAIDINGAPRFWDTPTTFVFFSRDTRWHRCDVTGRCTPLTLPDDLSRAAIVERAGIPPGD